MPLGKRADYGDSKFAGVQIPFAHDVASAMQDYLLCGFDFVVAPLAHPDHGQPLLQPPATPMVEAVPRKELMLTSAQWGGQIVGQVSAWIEPDAADAQACSCSCTALQQELSWAGFLGLQAVLLPMQRAPLQHAINYAQVVNQALGGLTNMAVWVQLPMHLPTVHSNHTSNINSSATGSNPSPSSSGGLSSSSSSSLNSWDWWWQLFTLCEHSSLLGVALEVPANVPPQPLVRRWLGQPVKALVLPTSVFITNKRGYPTLPKAHQELLTLFFKHGVQVVLSGEPLHHVAPAPAAALTPQPPAGHSTDHSFPIINPGESHALRPYWEYLCYLFRRMEDLGPQEVLEASYRDYLQAPLQPLQDNLESQTYETFEKDTVKYTTYGAAVEAALLDRVPEDQATSTVTVLMVVGAGRGPLVRASIEAGKRCQRRLKVYAVEKNAAAVVHIQNMVLSEGWQDQVTIVSCDMRTWSAPEPADILVSELLGSFGDNELSPECLDGAQRFLRPGGISIPSSYTSFLAPVTTAKLHEAVRAYKDREHLETPYVVKFHRHHLLSPPQPVFTFEHPAPQPADNSRRITLSFPRNPKDGAGALHGFAGYFESVLYKHVTLNTHPPTHTPNMFSWFPIFFPLREPLCLPAGEPVVVHMWRLCGAHKVWYEWAVGGPVATPIHNPGGRSYWVGL